MPPRVAQIVARVAACLVTTLMVGTVGIGIRRYRSLGHLLSLKELPTHLYRVPMWPISLLMAIAVAMVAVTSYAAGFKA